MNTIGIDFGTTKTLVSWFDPAKKEPRLVRLGREKDAIPSTVYVHENGSLAFGDEAEDMAEFDASRYCRGFKLDLGTDVPCLMASVQNGVATYTALELTTAFLKHVRTECEQKLFMGKEEIKKAQITMPVAFGEAQKEDLCEAAHKAGFEEVTLILEPEAAGTAFCRMAPEQAFQGTALVVDWGGGTLDMAVVSRTEDAVQVHEKNTRGNTAMGGEQIDRLLWEHVRHRIRNAGGSDPGDASPEQAGLLLRKVRQAKEALSDRVVYPLILNWKTRTGDLRTARETLESGEVEQLLTEIVGVAAQMVEDILKGCHQKPGMVLLIGGTSRIPLVARRLEEKTGLPAHRWEYSHEAVGLGASFCSEEQRKAEQERGNNELQRQTSERRKELEQRERLAEEGLAYFRDCRYDRAMEKWKEAAEQEHPAALNALGYCYQKGLGTNRSDKEAFSHFQKAFDQGSTAALNNLGVCYRYGYGVHKDEKRSFDIFHEAAQQGVAAAQYNLCSAYRFGWGTEKDISRSREWFERNKSACQRWLKIVFPEDADASDKAEKMFSNSFWKRYYPWWLFIFIVTGGFFAIFLAIYSISIGIGFSRAKGNLCRQQLILFK